MFNTSEMEKVFNSYGAALSAKDFISIYGKEKGFSDAVASENNLTMRKYVIACGFNRVSRSFADDLINKPKRI